MCNPLYKGLPKTIFFVKKIAIFASGSGTNAENIVQFFSESQQLQVDSIWTNNSTAGVIERMKPYNCSVFVFNKTDFSSGKVLSQIQDRAIDGIVLAGFLLLIPPAFIEAFPNCIINIHPALLPKHGGKGMYGSRVHEAVHQQGDKETGITIHYVNEHYDEGGIIHQASITIESEDTPETIAQKVHQLEYEHFPRMIEKIFSSHV